MGNSESSNLGRPLLVSTTPAYVVALGHPLRIACGYTVEFTKLRRYFPKSFLDHSICCLLKYTSMPPCVSAYFERGFF